MWSRFEVFLGIKASDEASAVLQEASKNAEDFRRKVMELAKQVEQGGEAGRKAYGEMRELSRQMSANEKAAKLLVDAWEDHHRVGLQLVDTLQSVSNMANRALNMFTQYNTLQIRINQLEEQRVDALQRLQAAEAELTAAQENLNLAIQTYGAGSKEAEEAAKKVEKAQKELTKAQEEAENAASKLAAAQQQNTMMLVGFVLQAPAFINQAVKMGEQVMKLATTVSAAGGVMGVFQDGIEAVSGALSFLAANPIMLVIAGIAAVAVVLWQLYEKCEPFRNMVNSIAEVVGGALLAAWNALSSGLKWFMDNVLMPIYNALKWVYDVIMGIASALGLAGSKAQEAGRAAAEAQAAAAGVPGTVVTPGMLPETAAPASIAARAAAPTTTVSINAPLVNIEGSADEKTAMKAAEIVKTSLKTTIIEPTSSEAPTKSIRMGGGAEVMMF
ncbi:MAG: hypothetical protein QW334_00270 [Thermofilum sp.]